jgi:hypothetical protein
MSPERHFFGKAQPGFFQHPHRGDILWHPQADDPFEAEIGEPEGAPRAI